MSSKPGGKHKGNSGYQGNRKHSFQCFQTFSAHGNHDKRSQNHQRNQLCTGRCRKNPGIHAGYRSQRNRGNSYRTESRRRGVGHQADTGCKNRIHAQTNQHACGNGDCRSESGHSFHKSAKAPGNDQHQHPFITGNRCQHFFNHIHSLCFQRQVIRKYSRNDNQADGPEGHEEALQAGGGRIQRIHLPEGQSQNHRQHQSNAACFIAGHFQTAQSNHQPDDGEHCQQKV